MDMKDLRKKNTVELAKDLMEKTKTLNNIKFGISKTKTKNVKEGKNLKKEIAQILTLLNEMKSQKK